MYTEEQLSEIIAERDQLKTEGAIMRDVMKDFLTVFGVFDKEGKLNDEFNPASPPEVQEDAMGIIMKSVSTLIMDVSMAKVMPSKAKELETKFAFFVKLKPIIAKYA